MVTLILSTPFFFEKAFKKWLLSNRRCDETAIAFGKRFGCHPIRDFFLNKFNDITKKLVPIKAEGICDYEPVIHRPPAVSLPVCGHVAGATFFYPPNVIINPVTNQPKRRMGLALHPKYGGHFSFRGVIIFPEIQLPDNFKESVAEKTLKNEDEINEALELVNVHWRDNRYRDLGNPAIRYSDLQLQYFSTQPRHRWKLIAHWFD